MSVLRYVRLDVFTNQPFTGIQLPVFPDAAGIDERRMQRIANEMALPETTFVFPPEAPKTDARVRIFTPSRELPDRRPFRLSEVLGEPVDHRQLQHVLFVKTSVSVLNPLPWRFASS
jgi:hypothetical protein